MNRLTAPLLATAIVGAALSTFPVTLSPSTLPGGAVGSPYVQSLTAAGGTPPYSTPSVLTGAVPPGTTFGPGTASFSFTPAAVTTYSFTLSMTDSAAGSTTPAYSSDVSAELATAWP